MLVFFSVALEHAIEICIPVKREESLMIAKRLANPRVGSTMRETIRKTQFNAINNGMLETLAVPVLTKAIDFLFEEGHRILQERRSRKGKDPNASSPASQNANIISASSRQPAHSTPVAIASREEALHHNVQEKVWSLHRADVEHLVTLLDVYSKNYRLAKEAYAKWGSDLVPAVIVHRLEEAEDGVLNTMQKLQTTLQKIYDKPLVIQDLNELAPN